MSKKNYSTEKSQFVQSQMKQGKTNQQARKEWNKTDHSNRNSSVDEDNQPIFRPEGEEWDDYAWSGEDF